MRSLYAADNRLRWARTSLSTSWVQIATNIISSESPFVAEVSAYNHHDSEGILLILGILCRGS